MYLTYPVLYWRNLFIEIANQLAEYEEKELTKKLMEDKKEDKNKDKAEKVPNLKAEIKDKKIHLVAERLS